MTGPSASPQCFDDFMAAAWSDHGVKPQEVADRLAASLAIVTEAKHIAPFAGLVTHVHGEHLGQFQRGADLLQSMRRLPASDGSDGVARSIDRNVAALLYTGGDSAAMQSLAEDDKAVALAVAASAFAGREETQRAIAAFDEALAIGEAGLRTGSPAIRALAVTGNNLAAALESRQDRSETETQGMVAAAQAGLKYWKQAGTWLEEERAHYRLARSNLQAGRVQDAIASARSCIAVCEANDAPVFERFFGFAVLAIAQRAAGDAGFAASRDEAKRLYEQVPPGEKSWCESDLKELPA